MGGRVQVIMDGLPSLAGAINGGQLKLLAVGSAKRLPNRPETPTIAETLPAIPRALGWFALMGPPGTPEPVAKKISDDLRAVLNEPALKQAVRGYRQLHQPDVAQRSCATTSAPSSRCGSR